jgi:hypothetical protein
MFFTTLQETHKEILTVSFLYCIQVAWRWEVISVAWGTEIMLAPYIP